MATAPIGLPRPPLPWRLWLVPVATTVAGSLLGLLPIVVEAPWWPSCGLLMALGWRLLRPGLWMAWVALPLGLVDDCVGGAPLGSAAALWTIAFLALDIPDARMIDRAFIDEWQIGGVAIVAAPVGTWAIARFTGGAVPIVAMLPQVVLGILAFPMALRICARADRWRLKRGPGLPS